MKYNKFILVSIFGIFSLSANANEKDSNEHMAAFAKSKNCMACHTMEKKLVGPSFNDIQRKYSNDKKAPDVLANKVIKGSSGSWGVVPMPANTQLTEEEAKKLVSWILEKK